ncbi:hypothetical protein PCYB_081790, partial [Plasmodium cynomolgi strain B]
MNTPAQTNSNRKMNQPADIKYQFTKTKICRHFLENRCMNKENCNYAHVLEELRPLPNLENTKLCKSVKKKIPCYNPNCKYAHRIEKLQPSTDLATYKTTLCYFWKKKKCMNQDKCRFAHETPYNKRTNQTHSYLLEEERVPDILSSIHLFESNPVMENGLFQLNDNFLNICNRLNFDMDELYAPPGYTYSREHEQKESEENNIWEDSIVDMNFLNLDYLNDEEEVAKYELFRGSSLDVNLENIQALSVRVNQDAHMSMSRNYDANMW